MNDFFIQQVTKLDSPQREQLRAIWEESFPASERGDFGEMMDDIAAGTRWLFILVEANRLIGFAVVLHSIIAGVHLLEYLAIARGKRNRGLGAKLLSQMQDQIKQRGYSSGIIFEVESDADGEPERELRARRIDFYKRNGAHLVEDAPVYRVPNLASEGTLNMRLMWLPLHNQMLTGDDLRRTIIAIYTCAYELPAEHPLIQDALAHLIG